MLEADTKVEEEEEDVKQDEDDHEGFLKKQQETWHAKVAEGRTRTITNK